MADNDKQLRARLVKLLEVARDLHGKQAAILDEVDELLAGGAGIGAKMKAIQAGFAAAWSDRYAPGQPERYVWTYKQDGPNLKRLAKQPGVEETIARAARYIRSEDGFFVRGRHSFGLFVRSINQWAAAGDAPAGEVDDEVADEVAQTAARRRALRA